LLKNICAYITTNALPEQNIIAANEGGAIALGVGYHLATNNVPLIYMQNSGIGNAVNPLLSLADKEVYSIPLILLIGWRGEPGIKDEPQHIKQGRVTKALLDVMEIPYQIIDGEANFKKVIRISVNTAKENSAPVAILVKKDTFNSFTLNQYDVNLYEFTREKALEEILKYIPNNAVIISTTGMLSRELFELREKNNQSHETDFLTVGSMGHTSQIALGIALAQPEKLVFCFDGDGSALMHLGSYAIAGSLSPKNLKIIVFNNGAHDSVGGQPTIGQWINFSKVTEAVNIKSFGEVMNLNEFATVLPQFVKANEIAFLDVRIKKGARKDLGRPTFTPLQNKNLLQSYIQK
jgi:phosphonopyruvate decarboxylase